MTLTLESQEHGSNAADAMLSLAVLSCVPRSSPGAAEGGRTVTLDSTGLGADPGWAPCLPQKQINRETQEKVTDIKHISCQILA